MFKKIVVMCFTLTCLWQTPCVGAFALSRPYVSVAQQQALLNENSIYFNGLTYYFKFGDDLKNEYYLQDENRSGWTSLMGVYKFEGRKNAAEAADVLYQGFSDQGVPVQKAVHKTNKEAVVTFMVNNNGILELNIWRLYKEPGDAYVTALQFAKAVKMPHTSEQGERLKKDGTDLTYQLLSAKREKFIE